MTEVDNSTGSSQGNLYCIEQGYSQPDKLCYM